MDIHVRQSLRAKRISLVVHWDGKVEVVVPAKRPPSEAYLRRFVEKHQGWIERHRQRMEKNKDKTPLSHRGVPVEVVKENTKMLIEEYLESLPTDYPITGIRVRNYKSQWGSCSSSKHLSFHYKLSLLPLSLAHYVIAHELSHLTHMNHSKDFWEAVGELCEDPKACRKMLKKYLL